jgi:hypothetical protein
MRYFGRRVASDPPWPGSGHGAPSGLNVDGLREQHRSTHATRGAHLDNLVLLRR